MRAADGTPWYRRITSSGRYDPAIDGIRFVAIVPVVLLHLDTWTGAQWTAAHPDGGRGLVSAVLQRGGVGVMLFFVLSGLVLGEPFARRARGIGPPVSLGRYLRRRVTRLEPPYIANLLALFAVLALVRGRPPGAMLPHLLASATYLHGATYGAWSTINGVAWSLEVEIQFYLLAPLLALAYRLRARTTRAMVLAAGMVAAGAVQPLLPASGRVRLSVAAYLHYFLAGMLLAELRATRAARAAEPAPTPAKGRGLGAAAAALAAVAVLARAAAESTGTPLADAAAHVTAAAALAAATAWALGAPVPRRLLGATAVSAIGGMSYTLYLYHAAVIAASGRLVSAVASGANYATYLGVQAVLILPAVLAVGAALFVAVERPAMRPGWPAAVRARLGWRPRARPVGAAGP